MDLFALLRIMLIKCSHLSLLHRIRLCFPFPIWCWFGTFFSLSLGLCVYFICTFRYNIYLQSLFFLFFTLFLCFYLIVLILFSFEFFVSFVACTAQACTIQIYFILWLFCIVLCECMFFWPFCASFVN